MSWIQALLLLVAAAGGGDDGGGARDEAIRLARESLRSRLGVSESRIHLVEAEPLRWGDTSLGCPEKGLIYQPVASEGYGVRLRVDDRTFDIRVAGARAMICEEPRSGEDTPLAATRLYREARRDLAERLKIPQSDIRVELVRPRTWPDASLGCKAVDTPPPSDKSSEIRGFLIELAVGGRSYTYHADLTRVVLCEQPGP